MILGRLAEGTKHMIPRPDGGWKERASLRWITVLITALFAVRAYANQPNMESALRGLQEAKIALERALSGRSASPAGALGFIEQARVAVREGMALGDRGGAPETIRARAVTFVPLPHAYENQADIEGALRALQQAKASLERASPNHGDYRIKAIEFIDQTIATVRAGVITAAPGGVTPGTAAGKPSEVKPALPAEASATPTRAPQTSVQQIVPATVPVSHPREAASLPSAAPQPSKIAQDDPSQVQLCFAGMPSAEEVLKSVRGEDRSDTQRRQAAVLKRLIGIMREVCDVDDERPSLGLGSSIRRAIGKLRHYRLARNDLEWSAAADESADAFARDGIPLLSKEVRNLIATRGSPSAIPGKTAAYEAARRGIIQDIEHANAHHVDMKVFRVVELGRVLGLPTCVPDEEVDRPCTAGATDSGTHVFVRKGTLPRWASRITVDLDEGGIVVRVTIEVYEAAEKCVEDVTAKYGKPSKVTPQAYVWDGLESKTYYFNWDPPGLHLDYSPLGNEGRHLSDAEANAIRRVDMSMFGKLTISLESLHRSEALKDEVKESRRSKL